MSAATSSPRVVDASVWVGYLLETDLHHPASLRWLDDHLRAGSDLVIPALALVEISGAIARRRSSGTAGTEAATWVEQLPNLIVIDLDRTLIHTAVHFAATLHLRGADAIYVALAARLALPLITWDQELLDRAIPVIDVRTPPRT